MCGVCVTSYYYVGVAFLYTIAVHAIRERAVLCANQKYTTIVNVGGRGQYMSTNTADYIEIQNLISLYSIAVSRRDWAALDGMFMPDAHWEVVGGPGTVLDGAKILPGLRSLVEDNSESLCQMNCPAYVKIDGERATAVSNMCEFGLSPDGKVRFEAPGIYEDVLVKHNGQWRFASRRYVVVTLRTQPVAT
jgi:hypothetical protein